MITAGIATVFFILAAYVEVAGFHDSLKTLTAAAGAPLFALGAPASAGGYGGTWIDRLLELVVFFDMLAVAIGCAVSASRGIFAMARDRRIPGVLATVSRRHDSPLGATVFSWSARPWSRWPSTSGGPACSRCRTPRTTSRCSPGGPRSADSRWWWCTC
jgi:amino acid transporter